MISLGKVGCGRAASRGSSSGALRRGNGLVSGGRLSNPACGRLGAGADANRPPTAGQLFSLAKPPRATRGVLLHKAPFSATIMNQQPQQRAAKQLPFRDWVLSAHAREGFRDAMIKDRRPLEFLGLRFRTNASNMCGHASFVILALAYLETDVLALRGYAASGIGLSILFQFYRAQPLWIPIGWNGVFLLINASMIGLLLKERNDAEKLGQDPEQAACFREVFMPVELTPVDFVRLMDLAERRVVPKGGLLSEAGRAQEEVFLIVDGTAEVDSEGVAVCHLEPKQFVGSMAFNRFIQASPEQSAAQVPRRSTPAAAAAVDVAAAESNPGTTNANPAESAAASANDNDNEESNYMDGYIDDSYIEDSYVPGGGGVFEEAKGVALELLRRESIVGEVAKSFVADTGEARSAGAGMEPSMTTVTATSDVVVFAWDMHLLRAFIKRRPLAGASLQNAISADLTRKVDQSRGHEERYRLLLAETLDGGVITPIEKKKLHRYRDLHGISLAEHKELLREHHWGEEEFEAGFQKGVAPRDGSKDFLKYEALVRRELAKGEVQDKGRQHLRQFRAQAGIDAQEHLLVLEKQGWTADDYEVGGKGKAADFDEEKPDSPKEQQAKAPEKAQADVESARSNSSSSVERAQTQEKRCEAGTGGGVTVGQMSSSATGVSKMSQ